MTSMVLDTGHDGGSAFVQNDGWPHVPLAPEVTV